MNRLFTRITLLSFAFASAVLAQADKPMLNDSALPVIAAPSFAEPLAAPFVTAKGTWIPADGVLSVVDIPAEKHIPVLHHKVGLANAVIELEFRWDGAGSFLVGCDSDKHVGRVVINAKGLSIAEDSVKPSHTLAQLPLTVKQGEWHKLRVEWKGDQMAARLDGAELRAQHAFLATVKSRSWLAASETVKVRNLKISGEANP
ncbi:MAG: hypothetical protein ABL974_18160 [Prosthecobacter sp.]